MIIKHIWSKNKKQIGWIFKLVKIKIKDMMKWRCNNISDQYNSIKVNKKSKDNKLKVKENNINKLKIQ
jgi:hypothetical protein